MTRWEHKFVRILESELEAYLNLMGSIGWELVSAQCVDSSSSITRYSHRLYFKKVSKEGK